MRIAFHSTYITKPAWSSTRTVTVIIHTTSSGSFIFMVQMTYWMESLAVLIYFYINHYIRDVVYFTCFVLAHVKTSSFWFFFSSLQNGVLIFPLASLVELNAQTIRGLIEIWRIACYFPNCEYLCISKGDRISMSTCFERHRNGLLRIIIHVSISLFDNELAR